VTGGGRAASQSPETYIPLDIPMATRQDGRLRETALDDDARFREQKLKIDPANNGAKSEYREALSLPMLLHKHSHIQTMYHPSDNPVQ